MQLLAVVASWMLVLTPGPVRTASVPAVAARATPGVAGRATPGVAGRATPGLTIQASGSTTIGLQVFANIYLSGGTNPSGSITFVLFGPGDTACGSAIFASTVPVSGTSMNSARYTTSAAGTYRWTAAYTGDANNNPAGPTSCSNPNASVIVMGANTVVSVTAPAPSGAAIHGVATLAGGVNPTGTISLYLTGPGDSFCSQTIFTSTVPVQGNGAYSSAAYTATVTGTYRWRAVYSGDANNLGTAVTACLDQSDSVNVTSVSQPPAASINPTNMTFAIQQVGTTSPAQTVTVSNTGGAGLAIATVGRSGAAATDFTTTTDQCSGVTVAPGGSCAVTVSFSPTAVGTRSASLTVADNAAGSPHSLTVSGQATADRGLLISPVDGQSGVDTTRAFTWALAAGGQAYYLAVGTSQYGTDLVNSGVLPANQSAFKVPALPTGRTLHATLLTETGGAWSRFQAITFTAAPGVATFTNPLYGQGGVARTPVLSWSTIPQGQAYYVVVGTTMFGTDVVNSGVLPAGQGSYGPVSLPGGQTLYATLLTETNGSWIRYQTIIFATG